MIMSNQYDEVTNRMILSPICDNSFTIISNVRSSYGFKREANPCLMHSKGTSTGLGEIILTTDKRNDLSHEFNFLLTEKGF